MISGSPLPIASGGGAFPHPYVVRTPPYGAQSAGIRVLHWLCDALNRLGAEAWVSVDLTRGPVGADPGGGVAAGLLTPVLTPARQEAWAAEGLAPIVIHPESFDDPVQPDALNVRYLLNYPGLMGETVMPPCDLTIAYTEALRRAAPEAASVLFIPGSDPRWWTPPPVAGRRRGALVYAGKYVDHHRQRLPLHLRDAVHIHRHGPLAPTTPQLRDLLRGAERLYVFENTAVATEAALCGCPVVACRNWFFRELLAEHELGLDGFTYEDEPAAVERARERLPAFQARYGSLLSAVQPALAAFAEHTQHLAAQRAGRA